MSIQKKITDLLLESGLSEAEVLIYRELLKNPVEVAFDLLSKTGLCKSALYRAIESLKNRKMIRFEDGLIKAASLKVLVSELNSSGRKFHKLSAKLKQISPFLHFQEDAVEEFEHYFSEDYMLEKYIEMSNFDFDVCLDFGDFENFIPRLGGLGTADKFRKNRLKHASAVFIATSYGPNTAYFCTKEAEQKYKNTVKHLNMDFKNRFVILTDKGDEVFFFNTEDEEILSAVFVKSKVIAEAQRAQFDFFSRTLGN